MKKLVMSVVNEDKFGPGNIELRSEIIVAVKAVTEKTGFPRAVLMNMTLDEVFATWAQEARGDVNDPVAMGIVKGLHSSFAGLLLVYYTLDKIAKRTKDIVPTDWHARTIRDLLSGGGKMHEKCQTPAGADGVQHTFPSMRVRIVVDQYGNDTWYEQLPASV